MKPMLAQRAPADFLALKYPIAAEVKHDGVRCIAVVNLGKCRLYSRNGKNLENFEEIRQYAEKLGDGVYDGEIVSPEGFQKLMTRTNADKGKNIEVKVEYKVFDKLTLQEWIAGKSYRDYTTRCIDAKIGERVVLKNPVDLEIYYNYVLKSGYEGLILKSLDGTYESGKSDCWFKLKPKDTIDMEILAFEQGTGKYEGMLGALQCQGEYSDFKVQSYVGTGFTDEQRKYIWDNKDKLKTTKVEIEFQEVTKPDKYGFRSLRFPSFKCLRNDK